MAPLQLYCLLQVGMVNKLTELVGEVSGNGWQLVDQCVSQLFPYPSTAAATAHTDHGSSTAQQMELSGSHMQQEGSQTGGTPEVGEAVTTDMSDEVSHHASPLHSILSPESASDSEVKLSVWLQCVLPRFTLCLFTAENSGNLYILYLHFVHFVVPMGIFPWEIQVSFPKESWLQQSRTTQP